MYLPRVSGGDGPEVPPNGKNAKMTLGIILVELTTDHPKNYKFAILDPIK